LIVDLQKKITKIEHSIDLTRRVSNSMQADTDSANPPMRLFRKTSQEEAGASLSQHAAPVLREFRMTYKRSKPWPSRSYAESTAVQSLDQLLQEALVPHTCDLDIVCAMCYRSDD